MLYPIPDSVIPCTNPALEIRYTHEKGRGVFATRRISAWERLECSPVLYIPPDLSQPLTRPSSPETAPVARHPDWRDDGDGRAKGARLESLQSGTVRDVLGQYTYTLRSLAHPPSSSSTVPPLSSLHQVTTTTSSSTSSSSSTASSSASVAVSSLSSAEGTRRRQRQEVLALGLGSLFNHIDPPNVTYKIHSSEGWIEYTSTRVIEEGEELGIWYGSNLTWMHGSVKETAAAATETKSIQTNGVDYVNGDVRSPSLSSPTLASAQSPSLSMFLGDQEAAAFSYPDVRQTQTTLGRGIRPCETTRDRYADSDSDEQEFLKKLANAIDVLGD